MAYSIPNTVRFFWTPSIWFQGTKMRWNAGQAKPKIESFPIPAYAQDTANSSDPSKKREPAYAVKSFLYTK